ncbi:MAG: patatin-like phospholipase family protein [Neisseriaceae bacterium]|nr:MAG: patatin-like phospholipase family protein [Neisseriaceae bacterium]
MKTKIAIACQGGGSQTAFTAGVLKAFFEHKVQEKYDIVSLSGTSGGGICAFFAWLALHLGHEHCEDLIEFWEDNSAKTTKEQFINRLMIAWINAVNKGFIPAVNRSPASEFSKVMAKIATAGLRPEFSDLKALLTTHADFNKMEEFKGKAPVLVLGACNILSGRLTKFSSYREVIQPEHLMASACIPNLFPAVEIGKDAYWDGLFSDNPPIDALLKAPIIGPFTPDEIWVIKINPTTTDHTPTEISDIHDRRNQLEGNVSLFQNLGQIEFLNFLFELGAYNESHLISRGITHQIKIPKCFPDDPDQPYHIPMIEMSPEIQKSMNFASKLDRDPAHIKLLIDDGYKQGIKFLKDIGMI